MNQTWQNFVRSQAAAPAQADPTTSAPQAVLADLSQAGLIAVTGDDARTFLQGQLSTDINALQTTHSQFSSWNNAKGRVVTLLRLFENDTGTYMSVPAPLLATVLKRLRMYVLRSKVMLTDASDSFACFGLLGAVAPELLQTCKLPAPAASNAVAKVDGVQIIRLHGTQPRFACYGPPDAAIRLWEKLRGLGATPAAAETWELGRILAGVPKVHAETSEHFVAQMLGLEELDAVHFKKGCYLGQEVIARAHYRGAVKRHLHRARCTLSSPILPGANIYAHGNNQAAAEVVDACRDADNIWQMLIVLQDDWLAAPLRINDAVVTLAR